jgi:transaldolase
VGGPTRCEEAAKRCTELNWTVGPTLKKGETVMKFFLDTANTEEIRDAASTGVLDGVTTNPTLISKEGNTFEDQLLKICALVNGPVSAETVSRDAAGMVDEGRHLAKLHPNIVVKCPMTKEGLKATRILSDERIRVNVTLVFSAPQAIMAAKAGAHFVSPFVGRLDDIGENGMELIHDIVTIFNNYEFKTQVLVASIRNPVHVVQAGLYGADICTMPAKIFDQLLKHPLTDKGVEQFLKDWEKVPVMK